MRKEYTSALSTDISLRQQLSDLEATLTDATAIHVRSARDTLCSFDASVANGTVCARRNRRSNASSACANN